MSMWVIIFLIVVIILLMWSMAKIAKISDDDANKTFEEWNREKDIQD